MLAGRRRHAGWHAPELLAVEELWYWGEQIPAIIQSLCPSPHPPPPPPPPGATTTTTTIVSYNQTSTHPTVNSYMFW